MIISAIWMAALSCAVSTPAADKPHHTPGGFKNVHVYKENSFSDFLKWRRQRAKKDIPGPESYHFPLAKINPEEHDSKADGENFPDLLQFEFD